MYETFTSSQIPEFIRVIKQHLSTAILTYSDYDLEKNPLFLYIITHHQQTACDGILIKVNKVKNQQFSLELHFVEIGISY